MKVAIPISSGLPSDGGGYTFESQITAALIEVASDVKHDFWFFDLSQLTLSPPREGKNYQILYPPPKTFKGYQNWLGQNTLALGRKLGNPSTKFLPISWSEAWCTRFLKENRFDFTWLLTPYTLTQAPNPSIPYAFTVWDLQHRLQPYFPEVSLRKEWATREFLYTRRLQQATYIITGTKRGQQELEQFYQIAPERIQIIPFPTPDFALKIGNIMDGEDDFLSQQGLPKTYFFYPAQFWSHKNHATLLRAVRRLRDLHQLEISIVFTGSDKGNLDYVRQLVKKLELEDNVHFLGFVSQIDLIKLYQLATALVFPTHFGPDNLPPLEAFALGCPVIASNVPGASEQLGKAALLVQPNDAEQLALAIKSVYEDSQLRQNLCQAGLERAHLWKTQDYIQKMLAILDEFQSIRYCWPNSFY